MSKRFLFFGIIITATISIFNVRLVFADISETSSIYQKVFYKGVVTCFSENAESGGLVSKISLGDFDGTVNSLVPRPNRGIVKKIGESSAGISCRELFTEKIEKKLPTSTTSNVTTKEQRLEDADYSRVPGDNSGGEACYSYRYRKDIEERGKIVKKEEHFTPSLCISRDKNGQYEVKIKEIGGQYDSDSYGNPIKPIKFDISNANKLIVIIKNDGRLGFKKNIKKEYDLSSIQSESEFLAQIGNDIASGIGGSAKDSKFSEAYAVTVGTSGNGADITGKRKETYYAACQGFVGREDNSGLDCSSDSSYSVDFASQTSVDINYQKLSMNTGNNTQSRRHMDYVVSNFSDGRYDSYDEIKFSDDEIYQLYYYYLTDIYEISEITCGNAELFGVGEYRARLWWNDENKYSKYCYFDVDKKNQDVKVNGVLGDKTFGQERGLKELISDLNLLSNESALDYSVYTKKEPESDEADLCYGGSGSLGWIICPIITAADGVGRHMWEQIENYHLKIPASEIFKSGGGVETGWGVVRNIANTLFIVLFLVVIFSQLTGWGIDNYGIKKILPRLIVIAILMNLSYLICQIAVDLSNIFGMGLNNMFSGWAGNIESAASGASGGAQAGAWILSGILGGGGIVLFSALRFGSFAGGLAGIGMAVLGILIVIVVAMLTLYLILIAREAGIVLCIIIAPVAIVCYALPNTEKLAKKWFGLFKALLVVYPICGAMVGGGRLAGSILASIPNNPGMKVAAMLVQVLPFFLVPMSLKSSLSLMGNVGTRLSTLGRSLGRRGSAGARGAIRNSERFKDFSQYQKENAQERRARRTREGVNVFGRRIGGLANRNPDTLSRRQRDRLRKADDVVLTQRKRDEENRLRTQGGYFGAMVNKQDLSIKAEADAIARMNDPTVLAAERSSLADKARLERSKARTTLLANSYSGEGLEQLQDRWNTAFDDGNEDDLDALTNVIVQRYGTSGADSIAKRLGEVSIVNNDNRQRSMRTLQRTMNDNSAFANNMRSKAPDAFQMISEAGTRYDKATNKNIPEDLSYFTADNKIATQVKDWATASRATLQRAVNSGVLSERMLNELLTSDDPLVRSGLQSEDGKRQILEAALYNKRHNPSGIGPNLDNATAAANYRAEEDARRSSEEAAERAARMAEQRAVNAEQVIDVRRYAPKIVGTGKSNVTVRVMGDGRMLDEQGNEFNDIDLYDRVDYVRNNERTVQNNSPRSTVPSAPTDSSGKPLFPTSGSS